MQGHAVWVVLALASVATAALLAPGTAWGAGAIAEGFSIGDVLDEGWGWFIVVGLGAVFAVVITIETKKKLSLIHI